MKRKSPGLKRRNLLKSQGKRNILKRILQLKGILIIKDLILCLNINERYLIHHQNFMKRNLLIPQNTITLERVKKLKKITPPWNSTLKCRNKLLKIMKVFLIVNFNTYKLLEWIKNLESKRVYKGYKDKLKHKRNRSTISSSSYYRRKKLIKKYDKYEKIAKSFRKNKRFQKIVSKCNFFFMKSYNDKHKIFLQYKS